MNKILIAIVIGAVFVLSNMFSKDILISYQGNVGQLIGLGALVVGYFTGKALMKVFASAK